MKQLIIIFLLFSGQASAFDIKDTLKNLVGDQQEDQSSNDENRSGLSTDDMLLGLREALGHGVDLAIQQLGAEDGFYGNDIVRIPIPESVESAAKIARKLGQGRYVDELELTMNRAAESAVPATADILIDAISQMSVEDAMQLVNGPDDAVTGYFRDTSETALRDAILPIVRQATDSAGVTQAYKTLQEKGGGMMSSLMGGEDTDIDQYVTERSLDALFFYIAEQERSIREDPVARTTDLLQSLFGN